MGRGEETVGRNVGMERERRDLNTGRQSNGKVAARMVGNIFSKRKYYISIYEILYEGDITN